MQTRIRPDQRDSQQPRWMPEDKRAIPSKFPREIIFLPQNSIHTQTINHIKKKKIQLFSNM